MHKQIIWSPLSEKDLSSILEYLFKNWDNKVVLKFIEIIDNLLINISLNPRQYPVIHKKKKIRKCVITKHNTLYYRERRTQIDILRIFDNRQDPKKLRFD